MAPAVLKIEEGRSVYRNEGLFRNMEKKSSLVKALRIMTRVAQEEGPISLAVLTMSLRMPKPTVHRLASVLESEKLLQRDPLTGHYTVGEGLERLAFSALRNSPGHSMLKLHMERVAEKVNESFNLAVLSGDEVLYVDRVESSWPLRMDFRPGSRVPVHCTANGKLLLAFASPRLRRRILGSEPFPAYTKNTITAAADLARELEVVRRRGYSEDDEEYLAGVCCLAVPVRGRDGRVVAGLAVMAPSARFPLEKARSHLPDIYTTAEAISNQLGGVHEGQGRRGGRAALVEARRNPRATRRTR